MRTALVTVASEGRKLPGAFHMQGQAAADQAVAQIRQILDIAESIRTTGVTDAEVMEVQKRWMNEFDLRKKKIRRQIISGEQHGFGLNSYQADGQSWARESGQVDKWIFCLTTARLAEDQEIR